MANSIALAQRYLPIFDEIYKADSETSRLDSMTSVDFTGVSEVKILKTSTVGLGDYSRVSGYPKGDVTAVWETMKLEEERGQEFSIDRMDNEEALGVVFGNVTGKFMREHVTPEVDAYRFAKYASTADIGTAVGAILTKDDIITSIDEATRALNAAEVPAAGRVLFVNSDLQPVLNSALSRQWGSDNAVNTTLSSYNGMPIAWVPPTRFYTKITLNSGASTWGYSKDATDGKNINFMMMYPSAVVQAIKFSIPKIFSPDVNQDKDAWKFQFRMYHDAFVYENKVKAIYLHKSTN